MHLAAKQECCLNRRWSAADKPEDGLFQLQFVQSSCSRPPHFAAFTGLVFVGLLNPSCRQSVDGLQAVISLPAGGVTALMTSADVCCLVSV